MFADWDPSAISDLEPLRGVFDTSDDGKLSAADRMTEAKTLGQLSITEVEQRGDPKRRCPFVGLIRSIKPERKGISFCELDYSDLRRLRSETVNRCSPLRNLTALVNSVSTMLYQFVLASFVLLVPERSFASPGLEISSSLQSMEYERISIDDCSLYFERSVVPTPENNYFYRYARFLDIRTLDSVGSTQIEPRSHQDETYYRFEIQFKDSYFLRSAFAELRQFRRWVQEHLPESNYPYDHPSRGDIYLSRVHYELRRQVDGISQLNRRIDLSQYGFFPVVESSFTLTYSDEESLEEFLSALVFYSTLHDCD